MIVKLPIITRGGIHQDRYVNTEAILAFGPQASGTTHLWLVGADSMTVDLAAEALAILLDPEHYCSAGGPEACGYYAYLANRHDWGTSDLSHVAYHAAQQAAVAHQASHTDDEAACDACRRHERILRA